MIVVDASVVAELLLRTPVGRNLEPRLLEGEELHAPHLVDVEVLQVLRRYVLRGEMEAERAREAIDDLLDLPLLRCPHDILLFDAFALHENLTAYDAVYAALTHLLDATLLTRDGGLADAPSLRGRVERV